MSFQIKSRKVPEVNQGVQNVLDKPKQCNGCPLQARGYGFVAGTYRNKPLLLINSEGNAYPNPDCKVDEASLYLIGEAPAVNEVDRGKPFSGEAGNVFKYWILRNAGVEFDNVVVDNTLRCAQPDNKLPAKSVLVKAIEHCSRYERVNEFKPRNMLFTLHPSAILRDPVPLPLVIRDVVRSTTLTRCVVLLGKTAISRYYKWCNSVRAWRGHWEEVGYGDNV